jgi:hypothetical protein
VVVRRIEPTISPISLSVKADGFLVKRPREKPVFRSSQRLCHGFFYMHTGCAYGGTAFNLPHKHARLPTLEPIDTITTLSSEGIKVVLRKNSNPNLRPSVSIDRGPGNGGCYPGEARLDMTRTN